jgi:hypothetical protein
LSSAFHGSSPSVAWGSKWPASALTAQTDAALGDPEGECRRHRGKNARLKADVSVAGVVGVVPAGDKGRRAHPQRRPMRQWKFRGRVSSSLGQKRAATSLAQLNAGESTLRGSSASIPQGQEVGATCPPPIIRHWSSLSKVVAGRRRVVGWVSLLKTRSRVTIARLQQQLPMAKHSQLLQAKKRNAVLYKLPIIHICLLVAIRPISTAQLSHSPLLSLEIHSTTLLGTLFCSLQTVLSGLQIYTTTVLGGL